jgi:hypothetical protein
MLIALDEPSAQIETTPPSSLKERPACKHSEPPAPDTPTPLRKLKSPPALPLPLDTDTPPP